MLKKPPHVCNHPISLVQFILIVACLIYSCNRVDWIPIVDKLDPFEKKSFEIQGKYCTEKATEIKYPVRILFLIDGSVSMEVNDPPNPQTNERGRQKAFREFWEKLYLNPAQSQQEVEIGLIRFSAQAQILTGGDRNMDGSVDTIFTKDPELLKSATEKLSFTDRTTNYINVLSTAYGIIRSEALNADASSLPLTSFVVYFLSDGLPSDGTNAAQGSNESQIKEQIEQLAQLKTIFNIGKIELNTLYLSSAQGLNEDEQAQNLLINMAEWGKGTYRNFVGGENINFANFGAGLIQRLYSLKSFFSVTPQVLQSSDQLPLTYIEDWDDHHFLDANQNGLIDCGEPLLDSDGDGLADLFEIRIGTDLLSIDTDLDQLSDRVEWENRRSGLSPLDPDDAKCESFEDTDGDGLNDCEELFVGTLKELVDTDGDGLSDWLEFRFATSPQQIEGKNDLDWDGTYNFDEVLGGFDPLCNDSPIRSRVGYSKELQELGVEDSQNCYQFQLKQITAIPKEGKDGLVSENQVEIYAGEGAFDENEEISLWKKTCLIVDFDMSADALNQRYFEIKDSDFKPTQIFDPSQDCIRSKDRIRMKNEKASNR